jgi:hypothetical protein
MILFGSTAEYVQPPEAAGFYPLPKGGIEQLKPSDGSYSNPKKGKPEKS